MADFQNNFDIVEDLLIPKALRNDEIYLKMIEAGQDVMLNAIQKGANKHIKSGKMAVSLKKTKPVIDQEGNAVGRIKFVGSDGSKTSKKGQRFDRTNWIKAFRIEYGTSDQTAEPFVRPAIKTSESATRQAMKKVWEERINGN